MDMVEISCTNCGQYIIVGDEYIRDKMYCTLGCMNNFEEKKNNI